MKTKNINMVNNLKVDTMKNKLVIFLLLGMFFISFASAEITCDNPAFNNPIKVNTTIELIQSCDSCTFTNLSRIIFPNGENQYINEVMTKNGVEYNYTYITTQNGFYSYSTIGDKNGFLQSETLCFQVTPSGRTSSSGESILYLGILIILFGLLCSLFYFIIVIPYYNDRNDNGAVIIINKLKYLKVTLIAIAYPLIILLLNFLNGIAQNFTTLTMFGGVIGFLFETMLRAAWIWTIGIMLWIIVLLIRDSNFSKLIKSGNYW